MTSKLTREERVQALYDLKIGQVLNQSDIESIKMLARMALAAMDSEPVYQVFEPSDGRWVDVDDEEEMIRLRSIGGETRTLYTAPPSTVVDSEPVAWLWSRDDERDVSLTPPEVDDDAADAIECGWAATPLYRHAQPAKGLELAGWQFKSVNGDWLGLIDEHGKNQVVRDGYEVREVFAMADGVNDRDNVRREHAEWSQATFGNVGPVGPLKHLSKEALEAAAAPGDLSEWADMQFLMWDAQRRAGITDEQITQAMIEKLAVNKQREWPEPKDGEPRLHIKEQPAPAFPDFDNVLESLDYEVRCNAWESEHVLKACQATYDACRAAMLQAGNDEIGSWSNGKNTPTVTSITPAAPDKKLTDDVLDEIIAGAKTSMEQYLALSLKAERKVWRQEGPTDDERIMAIEGIIPPISAGNSPVIPDGYVMVPMRLTAENGAKGVLSGEFSETQFVNCPECFGDDECETCDGSGRIEIKVPVSWTTIKEIWIKSVEHFAAAPQENN